MIGRRLVWLDSAKGVGLFGFVISHFMLMGYPSQLSAGLEVVQRAALVGGFNLITGKVTALFGIMFGLALWFQSRDGRPLERVYLRLAILGGIGVLHGVFLFWGDVLLVYAMAGALVLALRRWPLHLAAVALLGAVVLASSADLGAVNSSSPVIEAAVSGGYLSWVRLNLVVFFLRLMDGWIFLLMVGYLALGYWVGASGLVHQSASSWRRLALLLLPVVAGAGFLSYLANDYYNAFALVNSLSGWVFGLFYLSLVAGFGRVFSMFAVMGSKTLSFYLGHSLSIVGVFVVGGLYGELLPLQVVGLGVLVSLCLVVVFSASRVQPAEDFVRGSVQYLVRVRARRRQDVVPSPSEV